MADKRHMTREECLAELKRMYDGYHFHHESEGVYNPFSMLNHLCAEKEARPLDVRSFVKDIRSGRTDSLQERFTALFARIPYPDDERQVEQNFQNVVYIVFMLLGAVHDDGDT